MTSTEAKRAAAARRRILAGLELSSWLHRLAEQVERPADPCAGRCGALLVEDRESYARRRTCPCRQERTDPGGGRW
ncbi:hypothetical protein OG558_19710 [Kribbella sp. NBC_01510]|uniref:hypothetical protein n=1 Tax=Kribbella sp. NBC_01510 TaxID=2903581 RepID=UPI00386809E3